MAGYAASFKLLAVFAAECHKLRPCRLQVGHLDIPTLLAFLNHLETDRDNGVRTRNARLSAINPGTGTRPHPDPGQGPPRARPAAVDSTPEVPAVAPTPNRTPMAGPAICRQPPKVGAGWFNDHVRICAGGAG